MTPDEKLRELVEDTPHLGMYHVKDIARAFAKWALEQAEVIAKREGVYGAKTIRSLAAQIGEDA